MARLIRLFRNSGAAGLIALAAMPAAFIVLAGTPAIAEAQIGRVHRMIAEVKVKVDAVTHARRSA